MPLATLLKPAKLKLSKQRQLTIPKDILEFLGVEPGESVVVSKTKGKKGRKIVIQKTQDKVDELFGFLKPFAREGSLGLNDEELDKAIEQSKAESFKNRKKQEKTI